MDIISAIHARRSHFTKEFSGGKLTDQQIELLLDAAQQAPSHLLTLPWRFHIYSGPSLETLAYKMAEVYLSETAPEKFKQEKLDKIRAYPEKVSHIIAICMHRNPAHRLPELEEICSTACAVQNMYLALTTVPQAGGYWTTGNGTYSAAMKEFLKLGAKDRLLGFFFLGTVEQVRTKSHRPSWKENTIFH